MPDAATTSRYASLIHPALRATAFKARRRSKSVVVLCPAAGPRLARLSQRFAYVRGFFTVACKSIRIAS
jgi:hypothetical protein